jgi:hypothetical protein
MEISRTINNLPIIEQRFKNLTGSHVDVGYLDADLLMREDVIINELGDPYLNIPGTHFFSDGVDDSKKKVKNIMKSGALNVLKGISQVDRVLDRVGIAVDKSITEIGEDRNVPQHILNGVEWEVE